MNKMSADQEAFWNKVYNDQEGYGHESVEESFYPFHNPSRKFLYSEHFFYDLIKNMHNKRVLTIGGGIDRIALYLAGMQNDVVSTDIANEAVERTRALADKAGLGKNLKTCRVDWSEAAPDQKFDCVIAHHALHHMDVITAVKNAYAVLEDGGKLLAMEPVCMSRTLNRIHKKLPFHPLPVTDTEIELAKEHLDYIKTTFKSVELHFCDFLTRDSISYILHRIGCGKLLKVLSKLDIFLIRRFPALNNVSSYVIIAATK